MSKDARNLSEFAREREVKTFWRCWEARREWSEFMAIIEVCKRIENIEKKLDIKVEYE